VAVSPSAPPAGSPAVSPVIFSRIKTDQPLVALTFDCCQTAKPAGFDRAIVDVLRAHHTPATFMLCGRWMETHPEATQLLADTPYFELGNHSYIHPHMQKLTPAQQAPELTKTQEIMHQQVARYALFFRPPYGDWNQSLVEQSAAAGMYTVMWTISTGDPDPKATVADLMGEFHKVKPGAIVLMHANGRGWKTAKALPQMLEYLQAKHLRPVTLHDLWQAGTPVAATGGADNL
jgi:peptidoglycan/xylan/chitin deacetylase (PgdA/CDA1 family)